MKILITGASGMLGGYLRREFDRDDNEVVAISGSDLDLTCMPRDAVLPEGRDAALPYDLVVHAAGTCESSRAMAVNLEGTRALLHALGRLHSRPKALCFISCAAVYSPDAGCGVREDTRPDPADDLGASKLEAERECSLWAEAAGVPLTVLRPAMMFGTGISGPMADLFMQVVRGEFIHVRGQEGKISLVTALDVASAVRLTAGRPGTFNVSDGRPVTWLDLAVAMSANAGAQKRMTALPAKWADLAWKTCRWIPAVAVSLSPQTRERRTATLTLDCTSLRQACPGWAPYDTLAVISRTDRDYPYDIPTGLPGPTIPDSNEGN